MWGGGRKCGGGGGRKGGEVLKSGGGIKKGGGCAKNWGLSKTLSWWLLSKKFLSEWRKSRLISSAYSEVRLWIIQYKQQALLTMWSMSFSSFASDITFPAYYFITLKIQVSNL